MIKACIFDLDGTLLDTVNTIAFYCNKTLEHYGYEPIENEKYKYFAGNGAKLLVERMMDHLGIDKDKMFDRMYKYYTSAYEKDVTYNTSSYDGIPEVLAELKTMGIRNAVISNKPDKAAKDAVRMFLGDLADVCYGGRDNAKLKPEPDTVFEVLKEFDIKKEEALYFGDTWVDMQTGKNAGLYTVGVLWGFRDENELRHSGADEIISSPADIVNVVKEKNVE